MDERLAQARAEIDELVAMTHALPDGESVRLTAAKVREIVDIFDLVMQDALEQSEQNRAMKATIEIADRMLARRDGIDTKGPIL
jgi:hypothetical protein